MSDHDRSCQCHNIRTVTGVVKRAATGVTVTGAVCGMMICVSARLDHTVSRRSTRYHTVPHCIAPHYTVSYLIMLCHTISYRIIGHHTAPRCIALYNTVSYRVTSIILTVSYFAMLYRTATHCAILQPAVPHCAVPYHIVSCGRMPYHTVPCGATLHHAGLYDTTLYQRVST